jgi:serine/threonine protein kinase
MLATVLDPLRRELPSHVAEMIATALTQTLALPRIAPMRAKQDGPLSLVSRRDRGLPAWLPPSRTLGGFYVLRALGSGAVGSVFVARRAEEKTLESAQLFALKVPEYGGTVARTLGEAEFFQMFREEAGALLAVPPQMNLARLVTFDAGARPKPILVMELVEGPTLERLIETGGFDMARAVNTMLGVAAGLEAMHSVGVGHLDLKPSNVILRDPVGPGPALETPVLVDFGLAGRKVRPGCATANYGAPEVWGLTPKGHHPLPGAVDVYAFGCLVYEMLHGVELFRADSDLALLTQHLQHDGDLPQLDAMAADKELRPLADILRAALRQDPRKRIGIDGASAAIGQVAPRLMERRWPLG